MYLASSTVNPLNLKYIRMAYVIVTSTQLTTEQYTTLPGIDCGLLTDPENGEVSFSTATYSSVATYSCDSGYALIGDNMRTCLDTGLWSGSAPTCGKYK